jgi:hypothetical protein
MVWQIIRDDRATIRRIKDGVKDIDFWLYYEKRMPRIYLHVSDDLRPKRSYYFIGEDAETFLRFVSELMNYPTNWESVEKSRISEFTIRKYKRGNDDEDMVIVTEFGDIGEDDYVVEVQTKDGYYRFRCNAEDMLRFIENELTVGQERGVRR